MKDGELYKHNELEMKLEELLSEMKFRKMMEEHARKATNGQ
ncbi:hypothetical protein ACEV6Q_13885 [Enterobacter ludwigii]